MSEVLEPPKNLELELYAGLRVVQEKQSEINRRIGNIERHMETRSSDSSRLTALEGELAELRAELEESSDSKRDWVTWAVQTAGSIIITSLVIYIGAKFGVNLNAN